MHLKMAFICVYFHEQFSLATDIKVYDHIIVTSCAIFVLVNKENARLHPSE